MHVHSKLDYASGYGARLEEPVNMAASLSRCAHSFILIKTDNSLLQWTCNLCHSGPHWMIYECQYCKLHTCQPCSAKEAW
ncbi:uncharacterized protein BROUX77_008052 [Berkeleyomyces rouxiae]|uniref:uncharacterized protein n=1 Tax=Berkeleyomyces rouxiae TaxID=2035830 RepID=UPI003B7D7CE0